MDGLPPSNRICIEALERLEKEARATGVQHLSFTYARAIRALRAHNEPIRSGKEAMQLKGIGKFIAEKIDQALQEVRSQNSVDVAQVPPELGGNLLSDVDLDDETILPRDLEEWLRGYGMEQHKEAFLANGFENLIVLKELTMSDLEAIGIPLLGHRKTLLIAATELKEIFALRQKKEQALKAAALRNRLAAGTPPTGAPSGVRDQSPAVAGQRRSSSVRGGVNPPRQDLTAENNEEEIVETKVPRMVVLSGSSPHITTDFIVHNSSDESYAKGNALFHRCSVLSLVLTGTELCAELKKGTAYNRKSHLKVTLHIAAAGKVTKAVCSCSSVQPGWCKHIVATLICVQKHNELSGEPQGYVRPSPKENRNRTPTNETNRKKKTKTDENTTATTSTKSKAARNKKGDDAEDKEKRKKPQRIYIPKYRSGAWALLVALSLVRKDKNSPRSGYLDKKSLIDRAEPLCDSNFYREANSQGGSSGFYTAWNSMGTLISKGLVHRMGSTYGLTDTGAALAKRLKQAAQEFEDESEEEGMDVGMAIGGGDAMVSSSQVSDILQSDQPIDVTIKETATKKEKAKDRTKEKEKHVKKKSESTNKVQKTASERMDKGKEKVKDKKKEKEKEKKKEKKKGKEQDCSEEQEESLAAVVWESSSTRQDYFMAFDSEVYSPPPTPGSPLFDTIASSSTLREDDPTSSTFCLTFPRMKTSPSPSSSSSFSSFSSFSSSSSSTFSSSSMNLGQPSPPSPRPLYTLPLPSFDISPPFSYRKASSSSSSTPEVLVLDVSGDGDEDDNDNNHNRSNSSWDAWTSSPPLTTVKKEKAAFSSSNSVRESSKKKHIEEERGKEKEKEKNKKRKQSPTGRFNGNERKQRRFSCEFEPDAFSCGTGWLGDEDENEKDKAGSQKDKKEGKEKIQEKEKEKQRRVQEKYKIDEIVLLLDNREIHENSVKTLAKRVGEQGVICETRNLALGDVLWVARCSLKEKGKKSKKKKQKEKEKEKDKSVFQYSSEESDGELNNKMKKKKKKKKIGEEQEEEEEEEKEEEEFVLDFIVERKRVDDLMSSIEDGRYREQKFRLKRCGVPNVIYLIEGSYYGGESIDDNPVFEEVVLSTHVQDGFFVMRTDNERHTASYLAQVTEMLEDKYLERRRTKDKPTDRNRWRLKEHNVPLSLFSKKVSKSGNLTVSDVFAKQLMQIIGCNPERALAIIRNYPTPMALTTAYDDLDKNEKKKERLIAAIEVDDNNKDEENNNNSKRKLGMALSKRMYKFYNEFML